MRILACLFLIALVEDNGETALSAVVAILVVGHEDSSTALGSSALTAKTVDLSVTVDLVVLEDGKGVLHTHKKKETIK